MLKEELYPFKSNYINFNGLKYHYVDEGKGEPILMIHGNPTWSFYYRDLITAMSKNYRVIAPDHIGMGLSDKPDDDRYSYTAMNRLQDLERLIDHLKLKKFSLAIHDWGGIIGTTLAARHPEKISKMVIFNTAGFLWPLRKIIPFPIYSARIPYLSIYFMRQLNAFLRLALIVGFKKKMPKEVKQGYLHPYDSWNNTRSIHRFVQDIPMKPGDAFYEDLAITEARLKLLRDVPKLLLWGMKDFVFCPKILDEFLRHFPDAEVHSFDKARHFVVEDEIEQIIPLVQKFMAKKISAKKAKKKSAPDLIDTISAIAQKRPNDLICAAPRCYSFTGSITYDSVTLGELSRESDRLAHGLEKIEIKTGSRILLLMSPGTYQLTILTALMKARMIPILIEPGMDRKKLDECIKKAKPDAIIGKPGTYLAGQLNSCSAKKIAVKHTSGDLSGKKFTLHNIKERTTATDPYIREDIVPGKDALIIYSLDHSGAIKANTSTLNSLATDFARFKKTISSGTSILATRMPLQLFSMASGTLTILTGQDFNVPAEKNKSRLVTILNNYHCSHILATPGTIKELSREIKETETLLPDLKYIYSINHPVPDEDQKEMAPKLGAGARFNSYKV